MVNLGCQQNRNQLKAAGHYWEELSLIRLFETPSGGSPDKRTQK